MCYEQKKNREKRMAEKTSLIKTEVIYYTRLLHAVYVHIRSFREEK